MRAFQYLPAIHSASRLRAQYLSAEIMPVLSANLSCSMPTLFSSVRCTLASGVRSGMVDVLAALLHLAVAAADDDGRNRIVAVLVAVAHVRSVQEDRMIQQRAVAIGRLRHLLQERGKAVHVPRLDLHQLVDSFADRWHGARPDGRNPERRCGCRSGSCLQPP